MAKEIVKNNQVEAPTLFIGVGGTGCDIVKRVAEMCRPGETQNISFVCLDTNVNDLSGVARSDAKAKIYYVQTSNTQTVGDYLSYDEDALKNWFPKNAVIYDKTVSEGAGQVRAISRLALNTTIKTGKIKPLYDAIDDLFRKDGRELKQALRIVIVSTSSGGTGSGIALPLAMYVRDHVQNKYPNTSLIVRSLILLPETLDSVIDSAVERDSQRRNAYATIKEINAFMMKGSGFLDVESDLKRYGNLHIDFPIPGTEDKKSLGILPFDFCFLMDGQDAEDTTLVSLEQYKRQAAQALYEQNIGPMQKNAFSVEDNIIKEMSNPGNFGRNRFGAIGAATIRYPYERVVDYVAYDWASASIGGEGEAAKWSRYDKAFEIKRNEGRKKGLSMSEMPTLSEVYVESLSDSKDKFSVDIRGRYLGTKAEAQDRAQNYINSLLEEVTRIVDSNVLLSGAIDDVNDLAGEVNFTEVTDLKKELEDKLGKLVAYQQLVENNLRRIADSAAEGLVRSEVKTINAKEEYTLEALMKNKYGEVCHPTAMRCFLYMAKAAFEEGIDTSYAAMTEARNGLDVFSDAPEDRSQFEVKHSKTPVTNISEFVAAAKESPSLMDKMRGYGEYVDNAGNIFSGYYSAVTDYKKAIIEYATYKAGFEYVNELCKGFENFFNTFKEKVEALGRKKDDLADELVFRKGDSVYNVCSSKELLDELSLSTKTHCEEGALLDSEANAKIFDAIKANVEFEREMRAVDVVEEDKRIDIFDDVLVEYFREDVRRKCDNLDVNIIEAIALENRLISRLKMRVENQDENVKVIDKVTNDDNIKHILEVIAMGSRLAAPSVQRMRNVESREITLCAYNKSLTDMRSYRVKDLMPKGNAVDSVSRYELRFFNALYNLTPDKLNKFAAPQTTETTKRKGGLYHNAYVTYAKDIGPDTTKGAKISTHIDKRWDNIAVMPELDFGHQEREMLRIHQAIIYGLLYNALCRVKYSLTADNKKVYKYHNSDERYVTLSVSNGTPCDEFYEIVDSMYISPFIVSDIDVIKAKKNYRDRMHHACYEETEFKKAVDAFCIEESREGCECAKNEKSSLFEIPVYYYASLPNNKRFNGELSAIVDAIIKTLEDELLLWEDKDDVKFRLCDILEEQYNILMDNYVKYEKLHNNLDAKDNPVIETIYRKIRRVIETTPEPSDYVSMIEKMKEKIR